MSKFENKIHIVLYTGAKKWKIIEEMYSVHCTPTYGDRE
jgi:hypothetical protein